MMSPKSESGLDDNNATLMAQKRITFTTSIESDYQLLFPLWRIRSVSYVSLLT